MVERAASDRVEAVQGFAAALRELREAAGTPSFRELAGRSKAISHTTLHEAAQGHRLPSWATTVEFVKACGGDPADYRERWEQADDAVRAAATGPVPEPVAGPSHLEPVSEPVPASTPPPAADTPPATPVTPPSVPVTPAEGTDGAPPPRRRRRVIALVATGVVAAAGAGLVVGLLSASGDAGGSDPKDATAGLTAQDCPVQQSNPEPVEPATPGDQATLVAELSLPDCSQIRAGETVTKTWRFKNVGTVSWTGYTLHRIDGPQERSQCQTITDTAIADTAPGEMVDVSVAITAPRRPGFCFVRFKFEDGSGRIAFPAARPVNFQLVVV